jgi:hypothetical protein
MYVYVCMYVYTWITSNRRNKFHLSNEDVMPILLADMTTLPFQDRILTRP